MRQSVQKLGCSVLCPPIHLKNGALRQTLASSKLCDIEDWQYPEFLELAGSIMNIERPSPIEHRKLWEFTQVVRCLSRHNLLGPETIGLSVAAGCERILFWLANNVGRIVATDIYGEGSFSLLEATSAFLDEPERFAPYAYPRERLKPLYMDAFNLRFPDNFFHFAICLSSLEHFGGMRRAAAALEQMKRVVRPGGVLVITTECALNGVRNDQVFTPGDLELMVKRAGLELLDPIDWSLSRRSLDHFADMAQDDLNKLPHINLGHLGSIFTSVSLALRKPYKVAQEIPSRPYRVREVDVVIKRLTADPPCRVKLGLYQKLGCWLRGRYYSYVHWSFDVLARAGAKLM